MPKQKRSKKYQLRRHSIRGALRHYGVLVVFLAVGVLMSQVLTHSGAVLSYATNMSVSGLLQATNQARAGNGVAALKVNPKLTQAAQSKANDMAARDYWSHTTPDGTAPWSFVTGAGYTYQAISENLAYGFNDSASVVMGWMNSSGHRTNMLNGTYDEVGFAFANSEDYQTNGNQTIVVAFYGKSMTQAAPAPTSSQQTPAKQSTSQPSTTTKQAASSTSKSQPASSDNNPEDDTEHAEETSIIKPVEEHITDGDVIPVVASSSSVSWLQTEVGAAASWMVGIGLIAALSAVTVFMYRHSLAWRQVLVHGEQFIMRHKYVDIATIVLVVSMVVVIQTVGVIR